MDAGSRAIDRDLLEIIESVYAVEQETGAWIAGILRRLERVVGDGLGMAGFVYSFDAKGELRPTSWTSRAPPSRAGRLRACGIRADAFRVASVCLRGNRDAASQAPGWAQTETAERARASGVLDVWGIDGRNPGGRGFAVLIERRVAGPPSAEQGAMLRRIAKHFAAAHRLREHLASVHCPVPPRLHEARLTPRERQVLEVALLGLTNKEIAYELGIEHSTVRVLLMHARKKLGVTDRTALLQLFETVSTFASASASAPDSVTACAHLVSYGPLDVAVSEASRGR